MGGKKAGRGADTTCDPVDPDVADLFDGDTKKFVNDVLVGRQHYLKRDRVQGPDPEKPMNIPGGKELNLRLRNQKFLKWCASSTSVSRGCLRNNMIRSKNWKEKMFLILSKLLI